MTTKLTKGQRHSAILEALQKKDYTTTEISELLKVTMKVANRDILELLDTNRINSEIIRVGRSYVRKATKK